MNDRKKKLYIDEIQNKLGDIVNKSNAIGVAAVKFFEEQFTRLEMDSCHEKLQNIPCLISAELNEELIRIPKNEEVRRVVNELNGESTNGPDSFSGVFSRNAGI